MSSKRVFVVLSILVTLAFAWLSFDFGITEDEQLHNQHGKSILDYFRGESDLATRHPIDASGDLTFEYDEEMRDLSGALNIYGGLFDLLCAASHRYVSPLGEFENRHLVNALFGALLIVGAGLTARRIAGWRAGVLALLLMTLCPRIVGHSMNNPVDLPFAALYTLSLCFMLRFVDELPRPSARTWAPLLVSMSLATDIRIAGLVLFCYLPLFAAARQLPDLLDREFRARFAHSMGITLLLCVGAYLLVSLPWPLAHRDPLGTPLMAFRHLSRLETFTALDLYDGRWIGRLEIPWHFVPRWLAIGTPLFVPLGLSLSPLIFARGRDRSKQSAPIDRAKAAMVAFAFVFPVLFVILRKSNVYNDARHLLFAIPPLIVLCAVAFERILRWKRPRPLRVVFGLVLAATLLEPLVFMVRSHPHQGVYFSPLIGGIDGAWRRYETDYWGHSTRAAVEWIQANARPRSASPVRVRNWYGDRTKVAYYVEKQPGYEYVVASEQSEDWDYSVEQTVACKFHPERLRRWPPPGTVHEILVGDTPLSAVVLNHRNRSPEEMLTASRAWLDARPTPDHFFSFGSTMYAMGRFEDSLEAYRRSARMRPDDAVAWHAVGVASAQLEEWDELIEASKTALRIDPDLQKARDNMVYALWQLAKTADPPIDAPLSHDEYIAQSLELHGAGAIEEALQAARRALVRNPGSAIAYNNVCAFHNALRQWERAQAACEIALALEPDDELVRNNLEIALRRSD